MSLVSRVRSMLDGGAPLAERLVPPGVGALVATSGSTGTPRQVMLSRDALVAAADAAQQVTGPLTWHLALPGHYVAGLMVVVRAVVAGRDVVEVASDLHNLNPTGQDAISLVPTQLYRALRELEIARRLARFRAVLVGGAPLAPEVRAEAENQGIQVIHTYGMSETCGGVVWDGVPLPGVEVDLDPNSRIRLRGPMLAEGYLDDEAGTAAAFSDGWFLTSDRGHWEHGRLVVDGRLDDVVITGGVNVDLAKVRTAVARLHPWATVIAVADAEWGVRLVLFADHGSLDWWRDQLAAHLSRPELPRQVVHVAELPRTAGGKPDRAALQALATSMDRS